MVKKQQKRKLVAAKSKKVSKVQKKVPKVKKTIKKESEKRTMKTRQGKAQVTKKTVKKQEKQVIKKKVIKNKAIKKKVVKALKKKEMKKIPAKKVKTVEKPVVTRPAKVKAEKKPNTIYTANQLQTYKKAKNDLIMKTNKQLADILQANNQTKTGTKDNLVERIADGITLGQIPRCPHCFGGRLRFNRLNGEYTCPGYQDDDKFRFCNKKFSFNEITRSPWVEADS